MNSKVLHRKGSPAEFKCAEIDEIKENININRVELIRRYKIILTLITKEGIKLSKNNYDWNIEKLHETYKAMLQSKGYLTAKGTISQIKLANDFTNYYREELLDFLGCKLRFDNNC